MAHSKLFLNFLLSALLAVTSVIGLGTGLALGLASTANAEDNYEITILHTNDFHARFRPISKYDNNCSAEANVEGKCFGGTARLITAIEQARAKHANTLLVDGGDQFQGTLFYNVYKGKVAAEMMNALKYDGMTVGNHEFDDGPETLRAFMDIINFPILLANANIEREPALRGRLKKSTIIEKNGQKIGLIGVVTEDVADLSSPGDKITFMSAIKAVQAEVDMLTAAGVNKIVLLSHSSYPVDKMIAQNTTGVDVIVGGHDNTYLSNISDKAKGPYPTVVKGTQIVQAYAYGKYLGELNIVFDKSGNVISAVGEPILIDNSIAENTDIIARLDVLGAPISELAAKVVGTISAPLTGDREICRVQECDMGNMIADAMRGAVMDQGYTIALMNSGGIRASLDAGEVSLGEVMTILPFQNTLSTFKVSGAQLLVALENGVSQIEKGAGRFLQVSGLRYSFDLSKPANEGRITSVEVAEDGGWVSLDLEKTYGIAANNFIRSGGDGYKIFKDASEFYDFGPDVAEIVADYIKNNPDYTGYLDGRIKQD